MRAFIWRALLPLLVFAGGIGCLVYGIGFHTASVAEEQEIEVPIPPPPTFIGPGQPFEGMPGGPAFPGFPSFPSKAKEKVIVTADNSEPRLIRDVTVGGLILLASGEIRRTYSGEAPSLCPT
jgi:hypothetical protein